MTIYQKTIAGTAAVLNIPLGMKPDFVKITNTIDRVQMIIGAVQGTVGYAHNVAADGTKTDGATMVSFYDGVVNSAAEGITLTATAPVNGSTNPLFIEYGVFDG
ncbi:MAG: hypothetical protein ACTSYA_05665 [Candidatus Kariarchaeaceae archaeon]